MKVHFKASFPGMTIDKVFEGTAEEIETALRNHAASKVPHIPFTKKDDKLRESLDVDGKGDWTSTQFRAMVLDYFNKNIRKPDQPILTVPYTAQGFIDRAVVAGMAQILNQ